MSRLNGNILLSVVLVLSPISQVVHAEERISNMAHTSKPLADTVPTQSQTQNGPGAITFEVLDVQKLDANNPQTGVSKFVLHGRPKVVECDVLVAGGGLGGIAAAIRAAQTGASVCITEETDWPGGQATAQGVSALDENYMVESSGAPRMYQQWREAIRDHYRKLPGVSESARQNATLNPGECWVSWLSFEPAVGLEKLYSLIEKETKSNAPDVYLRCKIISTKTLRGRIRSALAVNLDSGKFIEFRPKFCIDATELGDLLPLAGVSYRTGAEARVQTQEAHAPTEGDQENVQDFVYPFIIEFRPGENHTINKPSRYDEFLKEGRFNFLGYKMFECALAPGRTQEFLPFWTYRRLIAKGHFPESQFKFDVAMINWESNDLRGENIIDKEPQTQAERLAMAKDLSLGFLYWMQTELPRDDGLGKGYPELFLRKDVLGTTDGLSKYPYIRESRRVLSEKIVTEEEIASSTNPGARAKPFHDSVGIGLYPIDIHGHQEISGAGQASKPFQIPLSTMIQHDVRNLVPGCKNIGTTHVTNGAYRLHPVEWAIGEAAGELVGLCVNKRTLPFKVSQSKLKLRYLQNALVRHGSPVFWFDDVPTYHDNFEAIQFVSLDGLMPISENDLHFRPDEQIHYEEAVDLIRQALKREPDAKLLYKIFNQDPDTVFKPAGPGNSKAAHLNSMNTHLAAARTGPRGAADSADMETANATDADSVDQHESDTLEHRQAINFAGRNTSKRRSSSIKGPHSRQIACVGTLTRAELAQVIYNLVRPRKPR